MSEYQAIKRAKMGNAVHKPLCNFHAMHRVMTTASKNSMTGCRVASMHRIKCDQTNITAAGEMTDTARKLVDTCFCITGPQAKRSSKLGWVIQMQERFTSSVHTVCAHSQLARCSIHADREGRQTVARRLSRMKDQRPSPGENWSRAVSASQVPMPSDEASSDG